MLRQRNVRRRGDSALATEAAAAACMDWVCRGSYLICENRSDMAKKLKAEACIYTDKASAIPLEELASLYERVGFGAAELYTGDNKTIQTLFGPGVHGFFARTPDDNRLVGMVRAFSDDRLCTWVAEVCVDPACQRMGIGRRLMRLLIDRFGHTAIYLEAFPNQTDFFEKVGIKPKPQLVGCSRAPQSVSPTEPDPFKH
jgi:GNAT superfamily N-acetyltransferase